ncbi:hypothetical protein SUGI_0619850 [Cryptomeria japonica]|nr:hypothetical protein SUGI_0619850 [Cryptomeria japonica]
MTKHKFELAPPSPLKRVVQGVHKPTHFPKTRVSLERKLDNSVEDDDDKSLKKTMENRLQREVTEFKVMQLLTKLPSKMMQIYSCSAKLSPFHSNLPMNGKETILLDHATLKAWKNEIQTDMGILPFLKDPGNVSCWLDLDAWRKRKGKGKEKGDFELAVDLDVLVNLDWLEDEEVVP